MGFGATFRMDVCFGAPFTYGSVQYSRGTSALMHFSRQTRAYANRLCNLPRIVFGATFRMDVCSGAPFVYGSVQSSRGTSALMHFSRLTRAYAYQLCNLPRIVFGASFQMDTFYLFTLIFLSC